MIVCICNVSFSLPPHYFHQRNTLSKDKLLFPSLQRPCVPLVVIYRFIYTFVVYITFSNIQQYSAIHLDLLRDLFPKMKVQSVDVSTKSDVRRAHKVLIELNLVCSDEDASTRRSIPAAEKILPSPAALVHSLFERNADALPDHIAVQFEHQRRITYQQLNETANAVARQLVCGRGTFVPIVVQRSLNLVVALLAIMKAGAAYVLLSPDAPNDRNKFIVEDLHAPFVIVDESTKGRLPGSNEILIEDLLAQSKHNDTGNLNIYQASSDRAYVIYTSGTTGRPKGVLLSHHAACCGLSAQPTPEPSQPLRQLLCHSPNFSAAQRTILGTLTQGGTLCLASKESITLRLYDTIIDMAVSTLEITPSMLKLIDPGTVPETVKKISLGGEIVDPSLVALWAGRVELLSAYGLSECTQVGFKNDAWYRPHVRLTACIVEFEAKA